ncbi:MAG: aminotransferase class V-fold PLP-dependent enzyme [Myxococcota bacterium]
MHILNLDANASLVPTLEAKSALIQSLTMDANPSSPHVLGRNARRLLDIARAHVAIAMGGKEKEIFFTSGASEGNRWLVDAAIATGNLKVWSTSLEHPSLAKPLARAIENGQLIKAQSIVEADLVFATAAHNETGLITDWDMILNQASPNAILVADISQTLGRLSPLPKRVDAMVASAHKIGGYPGSGAVLLRGNAKRLKAPWTGGGQEGNLRPGTEAVPLICAFGAAAAEIEAMREANNQLEPLRDYLETTLLAAWPFACRTPKSGPRIQNTSAITLKGVNGDALRISIDAAGVCVGFGSACSALAPEPSPALLSMGLTAEEARSTIRFSLNPGTDMKIIEEAIERLIKLDHR